MQIKLTSLFICVCYDICVTRKLTVKLRYNDVTLSFGRKGDTRVSLFSTRPSTGATKHTVVLVPRSLFPLSNNFLPEVQSKRKKKLITQVRDWVPRRLMSLTNIAGLTDSLESLTAPNVCGTCIHVFEGGRNEN